MVNTLPEAGSRIYWRTWALLLALTMLMVATAYVSLPRGFFITLLILAMLGKASLVGAYFMHLRFEKLSWALTVAAGILATAAFLFLLISFDGIRVLRLSLR